METFVRVDYARIVAPSISVECSWCGVRVELDRARQAVLANPLDPGCPSCSVSWTQIRLANIFGEPFVNGAFREAFKRAAEAKHKRRLPAVCYRSSVEYMENINPTRLEGIHELMNGKFMRTLTILQSECAQIIEKYPFAHLGGEDELVKELLNLTELLPPNQLPRLQQSGRKSITLGFDEPSGMIVQTETYLDPDVTKRLTFQSWKCPVNECNGYVYGDRGWCVVCVKAGRKCEDVRKDSIVTFACETCGHSNVVQATASGEKTEIDCMKCATTISHVDGVPVPKARQPTQYNIWQSGDVFTVQRYVHFSGDVKPNVMEAYPEAVRTVSSETFPYFHHLSAYVAEMYTLIGSLGDITSHEKYCAERYGRATYDVLHEPYFEPYFMAQHAIYYAIPDVVQSVHTQFLDAGETLFYNAFLAGDTSEEEFAESADALEHQCVASRECFALIFSFLEALKCIAVLVGGARTSSAQNQHLNPRQREEVYSDDLSACHPTETVQDYCLRLWRQLVGEFANYATERAYAKFTPLDYNVLLRIMGMDKVKAGRE